MKLTSIDTTPAAPLALATPETLTDTQKSFSQILSRVESKRSTQTPQEKAQDAAAQLVSTALVQPLLERLRASNQAAPPFAPNQAERSFGALLDTELAQRMTKSGNWPLVDAVASRLLRKQMGGPEVTPAPTAAPTVAPTAAPEMTS